MKTYIRILFLLAFALSIFADQNEEWVKLGDGTTTPVLRQPLRTVQQETGGLPDQSPEPKTDKSFHPTEVLDSISIRVAIRPSEVLQVVIDPATESVELIYPNTGLTESGSLAVAAAPEWIREELALQLPQFDELQNDMANEILAASSDIIDEVAFVVAKLPPEAVLDSRFDPELVTENAEWIYRIADSLTYVELVELGVPGNEKTTTTYRCLNWEGGVSDTAWMQIPPEVYYWWVVHPVLTDEAPKKRDSGTETQQLTYGYFWREYLWSDPDPSHSYTSGVYPLLADYMKPCKYLWNRRDTMLVGLRDYEPGVAGALDALGNWTFRVVPNSPVSPRPIQPNQIAYMHGGNCGEIQDLFMAGGRTALIPSPGVVDHLEDHVWNEFFDSEYTDPDDALGWAGFPAAQVNRWDYDGHTYLAPHWAGYDDQRGGSKDVSFVWDYMGDGSFFNRIHQYSDACSLMVYVRDRFYYPVDGAIVMFYSDSPYGDPGYVYLGAVGVTGADGMAKFAAGESNPYYVKAISSIGEYPDGMVMPITSGASTGGRYSTILTLPGNMPYLEVYPAEEPGDTNEYGVVMKWEVVSEVVRGPNSFTSQDLSRAEMRNGGRLTSFLLDSTEANNWAMSEPFSAWLYKKRVNCDTTYFVFPDDRKYTFFLSNEEGLVNDQIVELTMLFGRNITAVSENSTKPADFKISAYPNPFNAIVKIEIAGVRALHVTPLQIDIYDISGLLVEQISPSIQSSKEFVTNSQNQDEGLINHPVTHEGFSWHPDNSVGSGIYFIKVRSGNINECVRVLYLK
ncbi:T9SS type A sorting domain-containing protein [bacterium]|nr:T9SS type A sorting domain-containing protein [bacterium]